LHTKYLLINKYNIYTSNNNNKADTIYLII